MTEELDLEARKIRGYIATGRQKHGMGFRQFLLRGMTKVQDEWRLVCTAHNLLKLARANT